MDTQALDVTSGDFIAVNDVPAILPGRPHVASVWRWIHRGSHGIRLRAVKIGGRRYVSKADLNAFVAAVTSAADGETDKPTTTEATRERRRRVDSRLAAAGL